MSVTGITELKRALEAMAARIEAATPFAVLAATALVEGKARENLARTSHARGTPTPSAPGQPPSRITGRLRSSFEVLGPTPAGSGAWRSVLGPTAVYARIQELGGQAGRGRSVTLPARPYLRPAFEESVHDPAFIGVFTQFWGRAITGG